MYDKFGIAERNAAEYIAALLKQYGWGLDMVTKHQDYDGKKCPHRTLDLGWGRFKNMVKAELDKLNKPQEDTMSIEQFKKMYDEINPTYNTLEEVPSYWRDDIRELVDKGIIAGTGGGKLGLTKSDCKAAVLAKRIREKL